MEFVRRESEIVQMLNFLTEDGVDFVVVGGYAVSGLGKHRFSVDCDVVISRKELEKAEFALERNGYGVDFEKEGFDATYAGEFVRYKKKVGELPVSFDLLVESLVCRTTDGCWSFSYIKKHAVEVFIGGIESKAKCLVPKKELIVAFKIHSARKADVRDIVVLIGDLDADNILAHLRRGKGEVLKGQVSGIIEMLNDERLVDSLKGVFTLTIDVRKQISEAQKKLEKIFRAL
jgi:hypothetical protein